MAISTDRRELRFDRLTDAVDDAEALHRGGYDRLGKWDLSQVCGHLADWMEFPLDGFPPQRLPIRMMMFMMRNTVGGLMIRRVLATGNMPKGGPTIPQTVPPPAGDETAAVDRLRRVVARFESHTGPIHPSPLFGKMDRDRAYRLQLIHCGHHLGFLRLKVPG